MDNDLNRLVFELGLDYEMQNSMLQAATKVMRVTSHLSLTPTTWHSWLV